ncbi:MAG: hypothetical protein JNL13_00940 [Chitinophagaceae bacterium]|nr:hypothetical protein [Chitinophagaceae bacterium]
MILFLCLLPHHFAEARVHRKTGVGLTIEAGQQIQFNRPDRLGVYTFRTGIPVAASVDFTFSSASTCGFMMSLAAEYTPYKVKFAYSGPQMSVREEYSAGVGGLRLPMYFFVRTRKDKMLFALGGSINFRKTVVYRSSLDYDNPNRQEYRSTAYLDDENFPFSLDLRYLYRLTPKSVLNVHISYNFMGYGGVSSLYNTIGPRIGVMHSVDYHFSGAPSLITVAAGYQRTLWPAKKTNNTPGVQQ